MYRFLVYTSSYIGLIKDGCLKHTPLLFKMPPRRVWLLLQGGKAFSAMLAFTVILVYHVREVGLDPLQLVLVGTALEISILLFEVPTGIIADAFSRRGSIIIGLFITGLGFIIEGLFPVFIMVALGEFIWGIGYTLGSGASQAWLTDEIGEESAPAAFIAGVQAEQAASFAGIALSVVVASWNLQAAILLAGVLHIALGVMLMFIMSEDGYRPARVRRTGVWAHIAVSARQGVRAIRSRQVAVLLVLVTFFLAAQSESYDRLWTAHLLQDFTLPGLGALGDVGWFGAISAVSLLVGVVITARVRRNLDTRDPAAVARGLVVIMVLLAVLFLVFAQTDLVWLALLAVLVINPLRELFYPLHLSILNRGLDPSIRATVISMDGQVDAVGQIVGGPAMGVVGSRFGLRAALGGGALLLLPGILLAIWVAQITRRWRVGEPLQADINP